MLDNYVDYTFFQKICIHEHIIFLKKINYLNIQFCFGFHKSVFFWSIYRCISPLYITRDSNIFVIAISFKISHSTEVLSWNKVLTLELPACINGLWYSLGRQRSDIICLYCPSIYIKLCNLVFVCADQYNSFEFNEYREKTFYFLLNVNLNLVSGHNAYQICN